MNHQLDQINFSSLVPHGQCWLWEPHLVLGVATGNLLVFTAYVLIPIIGTFIYWQGKLSLLQFTYPKLWRVGLSFICLCGLTHLIQVAEIWIGGIVFYVDAIVVMATGIVSLYFVWLLWGYRNEIVKVARILKLAIDAAESETDTHGS